MQKLFEIYCFRTKVAQEIEGCLYETRKLHQGIFIDHIFEPLFISSEKQDFASKTN